MQRLQLKKLIVSIIIPFVAGAIGNIATIPNIPTWYAALEKPFFNPPNWVFGPVWTLLYVLIGISLYLVWSAKSKAPKRRAYIWFGVQMGLNTLWSLVFFGLHSLVGGVIVIFALLGSIVMAARYFWPVSRMAVYLLVPYIAWVSFATLLTIAVTVLN